MESWSEVLEWSLGDSKLKWSLEDSKLIYKFSQNKLYSYNIIADSLRKIHISENREIITVQRLKYQGAN
jgi:hypothetical protein